MRLLDSSVHSMSVTSLTDRTQVKNAPQLVGVSAHARKALLS
jgi:hypothetical protein